MNLDKIFGILIAFGTSIISFSQVNSYEFKKVQPAGSETVMSIDKMYHGAYVTPENDRIIINEEGVFSRTTLFLSIPKKTVMNSSKYSTKNGYLFGIIENDSVQYILEDSTYYYGLREDIAIAGIGTRTKIQKVSSTKYVLNFEDNGVYSPSIYEFKGSQLTVSHFDYPLDENPFVAIVNKESMVAEGVNHIYLSPTRLEWDALDRSLVFPDGTQYIRK